MYIPGALNEIQLLSPFCISYLMYENVAFSRKGFSGEEVDDEPDCCDEERYWPAGQEPSLVPDLEPSDCAGPAPGEPPAADFAVSPFAVQKLCR